MKAKYNMKKILINMLLLIFILASNHFALAENKSLKSISKIPKPAKIKDSELNTNKDYLKLLKISNPLKIAINEDFPPFSMLNKRNKRFGIDIDLANYLGTILNIKIKLIPAPVSKHPKMLVSKTADISIGGMSRTSKRGLVVNFTKPYFITSQGAILIKSMTDESDNEVETTEQNYNSYDDLRNLHGLVIGVKKNTKAADMAKATFIYGKIKLYKNYKEIAKALLNGDIQAIAGDIAYLKIWYKKNYQYKHRLKLLLPSKTSESYGWAINKGNLELLEWLNLIIDELNENGYLKKLRKKFIDDINWIKEIDDL